MTEATAETANLQMVSDNQSDWNWVDSDIRKDMGILANEKAAEAEADNE